MSTGERPSVVSSFPAEDKGTVGICIMVSVPQVVTRVKFTSGQMQDVQLLCLKSYIYFRKTLRETLYSSVRESICIRCRLDALKRGPSSIATLLRIYEAFCREMKYKVQRNLNVPIPRAAGRVRWSLVNTSSSTVVELSLFQSEVRATPFYDYPFAHERVLASPSQTLVDLLTANRVYAVGVDIN